MHVATALFVIFAVWRWGDWRNWEKYHTTMLFYALGNMTYNYITAHYYLWRFSSDVLSNHSLSEMLYTFIVFPGTIILFLGNYPQQTKQKWLHYVKWILIYGVWELFFVITGRIEYQYGWNLGWSVAFLVVMFPLFALHSKKPLLAYFLATVLGVTCILIFDVPVHLPVEDRGQ